MSPDRNEISVIHFEQGDALKYMLRTDCQLDQFVNGQIVYKSVIHFLNWLARFQLYKAKRSHL